MSVAAASAAAIDPEIRGGQPKRKEIYTYQAPWLIYGALSRFPSIVKLCLSPRAPHPHASRFLRQA